MEEHLLRGQALRIRVLDESTRLRARVVLDEMGERPPLEAVRDPAPFNVLLPDKGNDLTQVDVRALGAGFAHLVDAVVDAGLDPALDNVGTLRKRVVEPSVDLHLEHLAHGAAGHGLELALLPLLHEILHVRLSSVDGFRNGLNRLGSRDNVGNAHGKRLLEQPVVHDDLRVVQKVARPRRAKVVPAPVHQPSLGSLDRRRVDRPHDQLAVLDDAVSVVDRHEQLHQAPRVFVRLILVHLHEVDLRRGDRHR
mmetsp:Transcript_67198/g.160322  ORF Transcript_67198/g.160322 Transcript_67198/m.160322 type:complete len:252 (-) Transcript_67198:1784-2539(-)